MSTTYRWLGAEDVTQWRDLRSEMLRLDPSSFLTTSEEFSARSDADVAEQLAQGKTLGAFHEHLLIGSVAYVRRRNTAAQHRAELSAFYVRERYRGHGVSTGLMDQVGVRAESESVLQLELWVWDGNARAIAFYERCGFLMMGAMPRAVLVDGAPRHDLLYVNALDA